MTKAIKTGAAHAQRGPVNQERPAVPAAGWISAGCSASRKRTKAATCS
jgi:hypothetical protein